MLLLSGKPERRKEVDGVSGETNYYQTIDICIDVYRVFRTTRHGYGVTNEGACKQSAQSDETEQQANAHREYQSASHSMSFGMNFTH